MNAFQNPSFVFLLAMAGVGVAIGSFVVLGCILISLIASNPWTTILVFGVFYAFMASLMEAGKI